MYQCKAGHLAVHKYLDKGKNAKKNRNPRMVYFFDIEKCAVREKKLHKKIPK